LSQKDFCGKNIHLNAKGKKENKEARRGRKSEFQKKGVSCGVGETKGLGKGLRSFHKGLVHSCKKKLFLVGEVGGKPE